LYLGDCERRVAPNTVSSSDRVQFDEITAQFLLAGILSKGGGKEDKRKVYKGQRWNNVTHHRHHHLIYYQANLLNSNFNNFNMRFTIPLFALAAFASAVPVFEAEAVPENDAAAEPKNIAERAPPAYWIISGTRKYTTAGWTEEITSLFYSDKYTTGFPATCTRKYLTGIGGEPSCIPNHFHYWLDRTQDGKSPLFPHFKTEECVCSTDKQKKFSYYHSAACYAAI
jgi:hypothetical protein